MACIQYPRKERGGVNPGSWEQPTIYKDPPKEIFTRKKERIEEGDVSYLIRADASRYTDAISNYAKSQNVMVSVDYQNRKPQTTTMNFGSASNPYKVNQSFRPPSFGRRIFCLCPARSETGSAGGAIRARASRETTGTRTGWTTPRFSSRRRRLGTTPSRRTSLGSRVSTPTTSSGRI
jgi:hypothetical protein